MKASEERHLEKLNQVSGFEGKDVIVNQDIWVKEGEISISKAKVNIIEVTPTCILFPESCLSISMDVNVSE